MFNSIDFSNAFKQLSDLDDLEIKSSLNEALNEQDFNLTRGMSNRSDVDDFLDDDQDDKEVTVFDIDAEDEDGLDDSNVGKILLQCPCCATLICRSADEIEIPEDEAEELINIGTECPVCYSEQGYKIIGKVAPYEETTIEIEPKDDEEGSEEESGSADIISIKDKLHDIESELDELPLAESAGPKKKVPAFMKKDCCGDTNKDESLNELFGFGNKAGNQPQNQNRAAGAQPQTQNNANDPVAKVRSIMGSMRSSDASTQHMVEPPAFYFKAALKQLNITDPNFTITEIDPSTKKEIVLKAGDVLKEGLEEGKVQDMVDNVKDKANVAVSNISDGKLGKTYEVVNSRGTHQFKSENDATEYAKSNGGKLYEISNKEVTDIRKAKQDLHNKYDNAGGSLASIQSKSDMLNAADKVKAGRKLIAEYEDKHNIELGFGNKYTGNEALEESGEDAKHATNTMNAILGDVTTDKTTQVESLNEVFGSAEIPGWRGIERQSPEKQIQILKCAANELRRVGGNGLNAFNADFSGLTPESPETIQKAINYVKSYIDGKCIFVTESLDEGLNDVQLDTDHEHISIHSEPKAENGEEMIAPLDFQAANEIADAQPTNAFDDKLANVEPADETTPEGMTGEAGLEGEPGIEGVPEEGPTDIPPTDNEEEIPESEEVPVDELDEESFDRIGESYFKKVYENVSSFKTTSVKENGDNLVCEGLITFDSGKSGNTQFILEGSVIGASGHCQMLVENAQITPGKKAMVLEGVIKNGTLVSESLTYNYEVDGTNVSGTVTI